MMTSDDNEATRELRLKILELLLESDKRVNISMAALVEATAITAYSSGITLEILQQIVTSAYTEAGIAIGQASKMRLDN